MKNIYLFLSLIFIIIFFISCGEKKGNEVIQQETAVQENMKPDTVQQEVFVEPEKPLEEMPTHGDRIITVQKGEWLYDIARKEYGSMHEWRKIYEANKDKISDPNMIFPNQQLTLPE